MFSLSSRRRNMFRTDEKEPEPTEAATQIVASQPWS